MQFEFSGRFVRTQNINQKSSVAFRLQYALGHAGLRCGKNTRVLLSTASGLAFLAGFAMTAALEASENLMLCCQGTTLVVP
jgi:hypothetical protein